MLRRGVEPEGRPRRCVDAGPVLLGQLLDRDRVGLGRPRHVGQRDLVVGTLVDNRPFGAVHGQFVVPKSGGGYQTIDTQRGSVTAVSATSITVKSADGFSKTYQVVSSTDVDGKQNGISPVKTGHQVTVTATVSGSTATAASILDFNLLPAMHGGGGWNHPTPSAPPTTGVG